MHLVVTYREPTTQEADMSDSATTAQQAYYYAVGRVLDRLSTLDELPSSSIRDLVMARTVTQALAEYLSTLSYSSLQGDVLEELAKHDAVTHAEVTEERHLAVVLNEYAPTADEVNRGVWVDPRTGGVESTLDWLVRFNAGDLDARAALATLAHGTGDQSV